MERLINAKAESLIGLYKTERVRRDSPFRDIDDLALATCSRVAWFDQTRLHSAIGQLPPVEYKADYYRQHDSQQLPPGEPARY